MKTLSIVIPFLNEQDTILLMLNKLLSVELLDVYTEIIFIDDGSSDDSVRFITEFINNYSGNCALKLAGYKNNRGKWHALKQWFKLATWDFLLIQDADLEYDPNDIPRLLELMMQQHLDIVYGSRTLWIKKFGNKYSNTSFLLWGVFLSYLTSFLSGTKVTDEPTCYKLFDAKHKELLLYPKENGFEWEPAVTLLFLRKKLRYGELPIHYYPRDFLHGKKIWWKDGVIWIYTLIKWKLKNISHV